MSTPQQPVVADISAARPNIPTVSDRKEIDHALMARMVIREGKSFKQAALAAGYSLSIAENGLKSLMEVSKPAADAVRKETDAIAVNIDRLKPLAINRLYREIIDVRSSQGMKAIELAGRFKETDWFVRNAGDVSLGIFLSVAESAETNPPIDIESTHKE